MVRIVPPTWSSGSENKNHDGILARTAIKAITDHRIPKGPDYVNLKLPLLDHPLYPVPMHIIQDRESSFNEKPAQRCYRIQTSFHPFNVSSPTFHSNLLGHPLKALTIDLEYFVIPSNSLLTYSRYFLLILPRRLTLFTITMFILSILLLVPYFFSTICKSVSLLGERD